MLFIGKEKKFKYKKFTVYIKELHEGVPQQSFGLEGYEVTVAKGGKFVSHRINPNTPIKNWRSLISTSIYEIRKS